MGKEKKQGKKFANISPKNLEKLKNNILLDLCDPNILNKKEIEIVGLLTSKYRQELKKLESETVLDCINKIKEENPNKISIDKEGNLVDKLEKFAGKIVKITDKGAAFVRKITDSKIDNKTKDTEDGFRDYYIKNPKGAQVGAQVEFSLIQNENTGKVEAVISKVLGEDFRYGKIVANDYGPGFHFVSENNKINDEIVVSGGEKYIDKKVKIKIDHDSEGIYFDEKSGKNIIAADVIADFGWASCRNSEKNALIDKYGFTPEEYNEAELKHLESMPDDLRDEDRIGCVDRTGIPFITIDPEDCRDMDDATYVEKTENGYRAYIAIADVSYYIPEGSPLDMRAANITTSIYPGDGVIPMLPERLSNGCCSLIENKDRRVVMAIVDIDNDGNTKGYSFENAIIRVRKNLSYEAVEKIHNGLEDAEEEIKENNENSYKISEILTKVRRDRGSLSFKSEENSHTYSKDGEKVLDAEDKTVIPSTKNIESLMILYDEAAGSFIQNNKLAALYRVHEEPNKKDVETILQFANEVINACGTKEEKDANAEAREKSSAEVLHNVLEFSKGTKFYEAISNFALLKMKKAKFSPENIGHFGLAIKKEKNQAYIQVTAPIRRYGDLLGQRIIKDATLCLNKNHKNFANISEEEKTRLADNKYATRNVDKKELEEFAQYCSDREYMSDLLSREIKKLDDALAASNKIGQFAPGKILSINEAETTVNLTRENINVVTPTLELIRSNNIKVGTYKIGATMKSGDYEQLTIGDTVYMTITDVDINSRRIEAKRDFEAERQIRDARKKNGFQVISGLGDLKNVIDRDQAISEIIEENKTTNKNIAEL